MDGSDRKTVFLRHLLGCQETGGSDRAAFNCHAQINAEHCRIAPVLFPHGPLRGRFPTNCFVGNSLSASPGLARAVRGATCLLEGARRDLEGFFAALELQANHSLSPLRVFTRLDPHVRTEDPPDPR